MSLAAGSSPLLPTPSGSPGVDLEVVSREPAQPQQGRPPVLLVHGLSCRTVVRDLPGTGHYVMLDASRDAVLDTVLDDLTQALGLPGRADNPAPGDPAQ